jgi:integrative and conjugative element protein (TIGR02256 family)
MLAAALHDILLEAMEKWPLETGGMLLGYRGEHGGEVVITGATGPGPKARHRRYTFTPDGRWQQRELAKAYTSSGRVTTYVGDWHSHPESQPVPSVRDVKTALKVSRRKSARTPHPTTFIVGTGDEDSLIASAYVFADGKFHAVPWEITNDIP